MSPARALAAAALVLAAYLAWSWMAVSPEDRVRAAIETLAETLSRRQDDVLGQVASLRELRARLAEEVVVSTAQGTEVRGRDAVAGLWQRLRTSAQITRVRALDVEVELAPGGGAARAHGVAEVTRGQTGVPEREMREVRLDLVEVEGEWLVSGGTLVEAVRPPR